MPEIGKLTRVSLNTIFPHEAYDFSVWLQDNIELLSDEIGLQLNGDDIDREKSAGAFKADLVTTDQHNRTVIIENQYGKSNHDHLGKVVTYASYFKAGVAIWICEDPRPEHIEAINSLNRMPDVEFYLVLIEAVKIEGPKVAVDVRAVAGPTNISRAAKEVGAARSQRNNEQLSYWTEFCEADKTQKSRFSSISPRPGHYISLSTGLPFGCSLVNVVKRKTVRAELYIDCGHGDSNLAIFQAFHAHSAEIDKACGLPIKWDSLTGKRACRISVEIENGGLLASDRRDEVIEEHLDISYKLYDSLKPFVAEANKIAKAAHASIPADEE